jgi:hypothetical protein
MAKKSEAEQLFERALKRKSPTDQTDHVQVGDAPGLPSIPSARGEKPRSPQESEKLANLQVMIDRVFAKQPAIKAAMTAQLAAGQASAAATRKQVQAAMAAAAARGPEPSPAAAPLAGAPSLAPKASTAGQPPVATPVATLEDRRKALATITDVRQRDVTSLQAAMAAAAARGPEPSPAAAPLAGAPSLAPKASTAGQPPVATPVATLEDRRKALAMITDVRQRDVTSLTTIEPEHLNFGGPRVLLDYSIPPPHTLTDAKGRYVETFRWFDRAFLVYDPSIPAGEKGSEHDPWFGISGPKFRCYYPNSSAADFQSMMTSGSSGRWLHAWSEKSNYVEF